MTEQFDPHILASVEQWRAERAADTAWTRHLPPEARAEMDTELAALDGDARAVALIAWRNTAAVYADPELHAALSRDADRQATPDRDGYTFGVYLPPGVSEEVRDRLGDRIMDLVADAVPDAEVVGQAGDPLGAVDGIARP